MVSAEAISSPWIDFHSETARQRFKPLTECKSVERWLRRKEPGTRWTYLQRFERFLAYIREKEKIEGPDEFIAWAKNQSDNLAIQDLIEEFAKLQPPSTQANYMGTVRSFLKKNGYTNLPA